MCIFYKHDSCFFLLFNFIGPHRRSSGWVSPGHAICNRAERNSSNLSIWNRCVQVQRCLYAHLGRGVPIFPVWIVKLVVLCTAWGILPLYFCFSSLLSQFEPIFVSFTTILHVSVLKSCHLLNVTLTGCLYWWCDLVIFEVAGWIFWDHYAFLGNCSSTPSLSQH